MTLERRKAVQTMTDAQFRELVSRYMEETTKSIHEIQKLVEENTRITQETQASTRAVVSIISLSEVSTKTVVKISRFISRLCKAALPFVALIAMIQALRNGQFPNIKDLIP